MKAIFNNTDAYLAFYSASTIPKVSPIRDVLKTWF